MNSPRSSQGIAIAADPLCKQAIRNVLTLLLSEPDSHPDVGVMCFGNNVEQFCKYWLQLISGGAKHFVFLRSPASLQYPKEISAHRSLNHLLPIALPALDLPRAVQWINGRQYIANGDLAGSLQHYLEAILLYKELRKFSHGSQSDLSNQFLAPARLLIEVYGASTGRSDQWKDVWEKFEAQVLDRISSAGGTARAKSDLMSGALATELKILSKPISDWFDDPSSSLEPSAVEALMLLLTRIRVLAGETTPIRYAAISPIAVEPLCHINDQYSDKRFTVLVVDDHAASWRPVFAELQRKIQSDQELDVSFEFSLDGKFVEPCERNKTALFSYYDLVILDVFLGEHKGTEILERLRRDSSQLPVLLWTTSRDEEVTTEAVLANGILLKKTVIWESLQNAVAQWAVRGNAMRTRSLPSPFFNHTIVNAEYRALAAECHEWCLKQLDSFHALDGDFFRYFTNHGGRHIVKLWELLDQALKPFLQLNDEFLLPADTATRELEIFGLYLAVICHELGMFPMCIKENVEKFSPRPQAESGATPLESGPSDYLRDVRTLHAPRGMMLLRGTDYWNDFEGEKLGEKLRRFSTLAPRVAAIVGYHARFFGSMQEDVFLNWQKVKPIVETKLSDLKSGLGNLVQERESLQSVFEEVAATFPDQVARDRLRRQSALFRFVDALDISASRLPPEHLGKSVNWEAKQERENLKRELCPTAKIENGGVYVEMMADPPDLGRLRDVLAYTFDEKLPKDDTDECRGRAEAFFRDESKATALITNPWKFGWVENTVDGKLEDLQRSVLCLQKSLDCWLKQVWAIVGGKGHDGFVDHLRGLNILDGHNEESRITDDGVRLITSIAGLSVAGELLDEYQAVIETELDGQLRLSSFHWRGTSHWQGRRPVALDVLQKRLQQASAKVGG